MVFEELGCSVEEVGMVLPEPYDSFGPIQAAGVYNNLAQYLDEYGDRMTEFARFFIEMGSRVTTEDYMRAEGRIAELKATFDDAFETCDLIMSPVSSFPGSITGDSSYPVQYWNGAFTMHANAIGHPAASVPAGFSPDGLPIGLQIIGRKYDEETVLAASAAFEAGRVLRRNGRSPCGFGSRMRVSACREKPREAKLRGRGGHCRGRIMRAGRTR